ncbi:hypothetical protein Tco_1175710 [Tanacetum coccineum]
MRELREDTFSENKDEDAYNHIDRVLSIVGLFNIPGVSKDAGPIPEMRPAQALTAIQTMADHSQNWHDGTKSRNIESSSSKDGLAVLVNKLDSLGRDMKKLKESVHAIQVGCQICEGLHLDKDCPLNEEVKQVKDVRYGELGRTTPFNRNNEGGQILAETIKKYIEEASMRQVKQDEWLKTFFHNLEKSQNHHDEIIQGLESRVTTLAKEAVTKTDKNEDCKEIFTNDGAPLYTLFYYSPKEIKDGRNNEIRERIIHNLHEEWFKGTSDDENDIKGIIDYLEPMSYDGFADLDEEEYNKRRCRLLGMSYIELLPIIIEQVKITIYSLGPGEVYTKLKVSNTEELPLTRNNVATIRSNIMEEVFENYEDEMTYNNLESNLKTR